MKTGDSRRPAAPAGTKRNPYYVYVAAERSGISPSERDFLRDWRTYFKAARDAYRNGEKKDAEHFWDGVNAVAELKKHHYASSLLKPSLSRHSDFRWMFRMLTREVELYRGWSKPDRINRAFRKAESELPKIRKELTKLLEKAPLRLLEKLPDIVREKQNLIRLAAVRHWPDTLTYTQRERREALRHPQTRAPIYLPPTETIQIEVLLRMVRGLPPPITRKNLDTHFQVRTAGALWIYLPSISYETISRLVALTYICGNLVNRGKTMTIPLSKRELKFSAIRRTLGKYGFEKLDRAAFEMELERYLGVADPS